MNKLNKIDYELRNMKMPFLNDAPLASSYAEKSGYAVLSDDTYFSLKDDFSNADGSAIDVPALESEKYEIEIQLTEVDNDILANSDAITKAQANLNYWITQRGVREAQVATTQASYDAVNSIKKKNRREEQRKKDLAGELGFYNSHLATARANANSYEREVNDLKNEATRLNDLKATLINQKAYLVDQISKGRAREIIATQGKTPEAIETATRIESEGKKESDILRAQADAVSVKSSSTGKLLLIVGGIGLVGLIAMLVLKRN